MASMFYMVYFPVVLLTVPDNLITKVDNPEASYAKNLDLMPQGQLKEKPPELRILPEFNITKEAKGYSVYYFKPSSLAAL